MKLTGERLPRYKIIKALFEHYNEFKAYSEIQAEGTQNPYFITYQGYELSYIDLQNQLWRVSPRKRQAMELHLIGGLRQQEAADIMGISPVTVGQYCAAGCNIIAKHYFSDLPEEVFESDDVMDEEV